MKKGDMYRMARFINHCRPLICVIKNTVLDASTTLAAAVYQLIAKLRLGG